MKLENGLMYVEGEGVDFSVFARSDLVEIATNSKSRLILKQKLIQKEP